MKAMILAAGMGTRLRPLTDSQPKALVQVVGRPLLEHTIRRLALNGVTEIIINAHHFARQITDFLDMRKRFGLRIEVSVEEELLGTGGGLQKAAWFFDDGQPFILHNVDVLSDLDLNSMIAAHRDSGALATLAVRQRSTSRYLLFDADGQLVGWKRISKGSARGRGVVARQYVRPGNGAITPLSFMGIHVLSPRILERLTETPPFSIRDAYLRLAAEGERILAFRADTARWLDVGRRQSLLEAEERLGQAFFAYPD